ncbi:TIGR01459 family HAD-type hydrolase [Pelagibacteraceae bacterium]|nr:TIGR01459 family HAD-type hydrolase [Pelagibacteraceae bacterium]
MEKIKSIREILNDYDNFIIDQWGVMHDGTFGYDHAFETINILNSNNKNLFIVSNSSKRSKSSIDKLPKLGFKKSSFINTVTSGEMIWQLLKKKYGEDKSKKNCFHIYDEEKEDGLDFRDGLNFNFVKKVEEADLILACTPFIKLQPIDYIPLLEVAYKNEVTMYCANPDFETVESNSNNNIFCVGAIAEVYKNMGGNVIIKGKPDVSIYIETTNVINLEKKRTIAIGDSLFHDIQGANNFEIDSILVKSGIHKDTEKINTLIKNHQITPRYFIDKFSI